MSQSEKNPLPLPKVKYISIYASHFASISYTGTYVSFTFTRKICNINPYVINAYCVYCIYFYDLFCPILIINHKGLKTGSTTCIMKELLHKLAKHFLTKYGVYIDFSFSASYN